MHPRKRLKAPVTIIIGLKCERGIIVACDSRTTEPTGHIRDDAKKLHVIKFQDGNSGLIAVAGSATYGNRIAEMIQARASNQSSENDYRAFAACAEISVQELRNHVRRSNEGATPESLQKIFEDNSFELMIANYHAGTPYLFNLKFEIGIAE